MVWKLQELPGKNNPTSCLEMYLLQTDSKRNSIPRMLSISAECTLEMIFFIGMSRLLRNLVIPFTQVEMSNQQRQPGVQTNSCFYG